jgi:hypothetical protein
MLEIDFCVSYPRRERDRIADMLFAAVERDSDPARVLLMEKIVAELARAIQAEKRMENTSREQTTDVRCGAHAGSQVGVEGSNFFARSN